MKIKRKEALAMIKKVISSADAEYIPPSTEEEKKIISVFEKVLGRNDISIKEEFFDIGGDSLLALEAAALIGVQAQDIYENPTAETLGKVLLAMKEDDDFDNDYVDVNRLIKHQSNLFYNNAPKRVLLTGATGFLGAHVLRELSVQGLRVVCLVRNKDKFTNVIKYYFPKEYETFNYKVYEGDIEKEHFGLADEDYNRLLKKIDMVIHTAANVSHAGHYENFERTNVIGTQNVIDFCKASGAVLQHTSTASVSGAGTVEQQDENATFDEFCLDIGQKYTQNVYIHSKYKAEERVLLAREEGLKVNIFRIGNLTWRMSDGTFQRNAKDNGFVERCRGIAKVGMYSEEIAQYPIDFTPVDECARAYVKLALNNKVNNIYNLYNPHVFNLEDLGRKISHRIKKVSHDVLEKTLKEYIDDKEVAVLSFYSSIAVASKNVPISNEFTVNELKDLGFKWSKIGLKYLSYMRKI